MTGSVWPPMLAAAFLWIGAPACRAAGDQPVGAPSPELVDKGKSLYHHFCQQCHGVDMVNPGTSSFDLREFPPDDKPRFVHSVMNGKNSMPAWGDILRPAEVDAIWAYVRTGGTTQ